MMTAEHDNEQHHIDVGKFIADEIRAIAEELEDIPISKLPMCAETITAMQKIDLDRQRLFDLCTMMENAFIAASKEYKAAASDILKGAKLERTHSDFKDFIKDAAA